MRILLTIGDISITGGAERVVVNLANALSQNGHSVTLLSFFKSHNSLPYEIDSKINLIFWHSIGEAEHNAKFASFFKKIYLKNFYKFFLSLSVQKRFADMDSVIVSDFIFTPFFKNKRTKFIKWIHLNFTRFNKRNKAFDSLVVLSNKQLALWQKHHKSVFVIPHFLPEIPIEIANLESKLVLSMGRMSGDNQKGFLRLLDIWSKIQACEESNGWKLVIVGEGELKEKIESKIKALNLQASVILKPFTKDTKAEYLQASIYAMASHFEGFGMVLAESASFGLPAVAFDVPTGPSEIIDSNLSGFLVEDNDLEAFANALNKLMRDKNLRESMGKNAKLKMQNTFSKEKIIKLWENLLDS